MERIGIVTIYTIPNYGSVLQAYATLLVFRILGYDSVLINYSRLNSYYFRHGDRPVSMFKKIIRYFGLTSYHRKLRKMEKFRKNNLKETKEYKSLSELQAEKWNQFKMLAVGSDQVWNPRFSYGDSVYFLSFLPDDILRISFSSSFALKKLPNEHVASFREYLEKFNAISVREDNAKSIINEQLKLDKGIFVLLDPTLLLSVEQWREYMIRSKFKKKEKFILLYLLDYSFKPQPYIYEVAEYFQKRFNYNIYVLEGHSKELKDYHLKYSNRTDSTVEEFIDYFYNADLVLTSSFHGTAFALNFGKPLISIIPDNGDDRQSSLLRKVRLERLAVKKGEPIESINPFYDVEKEQVYLKMNRDEAYKWIRNSVLQSE